MKEELRVLQSDRNYHQLERDTIEGFRSMSVDEVEKLESMSKMKDIELGELMEGHRVELEV
jgi:hypothetical protein